MIVVFVIGHMDPRLLGVAKRVKEYRPSDFELIATYLSLFTEIVLLPNTLTEASNLLGYFDGERKETCLTFLGVLAGTGERYVASVTAARRGEYTSLGLTDAAILCALGPDTVLLSADWPLCVAASCDGHQVQYFPDLRQ
ncbi:MAG: hypothetical protein ACRYGC_06250 [Janthinobacterium lividum]